MNDNVFLQGKVHAPHATETIYNVNRRTKVTAPLCGTRARRFYPKAIESPVDCKKCLRVLAETNE